MVLVCLICGSEHATRFHQAEDLGKEFKAILEKGYFDYNQTPEARKRRLEKLLVRDYYYY